MCKPKFTAKCWEKVPEVLRHTSQPRATTCHGSQVSTEQSVLPDGSWSIGNFWRFGVKISVETKKNREIRIFILVFCQLYFNYLHWYFASCILTILYFNYTEQFKNNQMVHLNKSFTYFILLVDI